MRYRFLDTLNMGIANLDLEILETSNPYSCLLYQHKGDFHPVPAKFGNNPNDPAIDRFLSFIRLAIMENVSLTMTPEYSCPWDVVRVILQNDDLKPRIGKLFALGCESITKDELVKLKADFNKDNITVYYDESVLDANGNFFDALSYIFKNEGRLFIVIQFKTNHMGVWTNPIERNNYKRGTTIYVLRNNVNSVCLFTLICSEAMNFQVNEAFLADLDNRWDHNPFIILNPQLNPQPNHPDFKRFYERIIYSYEQKDLICLNWANGSTILGNYFIGFSRSGVFIKSHQVDFTSDSSFSNNHKKGLYYLNNKKDIHSFYLCSQKSVYKIRCQKPPTAGGLGVQIKKSEPEVQKVFISDQNNFTEVVEVNDNLTVFLNSNNCPSVYLRRNDVSSADKERLIVLSTGLLRSSAGTPWYYVNNLNSYELDETWIIKRLSFLEDSDGNDTRLKYLESLNYLNTILIRTENYWPPILDSFKGRPIDEIKFNDLGDYTRFFYNFISSVGKATVVYLRYEQRDQAERVMREIKNIFQDKTRNRIVIWYKTSPIHNNFSSLTNETDLSISDVPVNSESIT